jgi:transcriptional regulator with PAS, ATPase and Fis domain
MKLSYTTVIRAYSFFSVLFFIFGALAIVIGGQPFIRDYDMLEIAVAASGLFIFRIIVVCFFGSGFVISSFILVLTRQRGMVTYRRIIERLSSDRSMNFNLNIIFPEQDEFGNLGKWLNKFMAQLRVFDRIKVERLRALQQQIAFLSESIDKGIVILNDEDRIDSVNSHFQELLNLGDRTIVGLPINKIVENEHFHSTLEKLKEKPKDQVLEELRVKLGETICTARVTIVPIISSEVELMQTMIVFDHIQKSVS